MSKHIHIHLPSKKTKDATVGDAFIPTYAEYKLWCKVNNAGDPQSRVTFTKYCRTLGVNPRQSAELATKFKIGQASKDASSVAQIQKEITNEERLLKARGETNSTRLKMLKEELEKAKVGDEGELTGKVVYQQGKWWYRKPNTVLRYGPFDTASEAAEAARAKGITMDAANHMGEKKYNTFAAWKVACRVANPSVVFEGDKDICNAKPGVGEWDGESGVVYNKTKDAIHSGSESGWVQKVKDSYPAATFRPRIGKVVARVGDQTVGEYNPQKRLGSIVDK